MMKLPIRPKPFYDESLPSYIFRLAAANHFEFPRKVFQLSGLTMPGYLDRVAYSTILKNTQTMDELSILSNYPSYLLKKLSFWQSDLEGECITNGNVTLPENTIHNRKLKFVLSV